MANDRDPFTEAREELFTKREEVKRLTFELDEAIKLNNTMRAEIDAKTDTIANQTAALAERDKTIRMLQAFSTKFSTLIESGVDLLIKARTEAMQQSARLGLSPNSEHTAEEEGARRIIERVAPAHETQQ